MAIMKSFLESYLNVVFQLHLHKWSPRSGWANGQLAIEERPQKHRDLFCILQICQVPLQKAAFYLLNIKTTIAQLHRNFSFWISSSNLSLELYYFSSAPITPSKFHHYKMYYHSENALNGIFIPCYGIMYSDVFKNHKLLCSQLGRYKYKSNLVQTVGHTQVHEYIPQLHCPESNIIWLWFLLLYHKMGDGNSQFADTCKHILILQWRTWGRGRTPWKAI